MTGCPATSPGAVRRNSTVCGCPRCSSSAARSARSRCRKRGRHPRRRRRRSRRGGPGPRGWTPPPLGPPRGARRGRRGAAVACPSTINTRQPSISASCLLISRGLESPAIFCRNGVWSKTRSRRTCSGGGVVEDLPQLPGQSTCLAVCGSCAAPRRPAGPCRTASRSVRSMPRRAAAEEVAVLDGHARAVGGIGRGRVSGVTDEGGASLRPLLQRRPVPQDPALHVLRRGLGDQAREGAGNPSASCVAAALRSAGAGASRVGRRERPPLVAVAALVPDRGPAALDGSAVRQDALVRHGAGHLGEREAAEDVQPVLALGGVAPEGPADQRVDAIGADQHVVLGGAAVGEVQGDHPVVLLDPVDLLVEPDHALGDRGEHPLVQLRPQQADEPAAERLADVLVQLDVDADLAVEVAELRVASGRRGPRCRRRARAAPSAAAATG